MHGCVFLPPKESSRGEIQLGELLEEEGAGSGPPEVSCWPLFRCCWSGQFFKQTSPKVLRKLSMKVDMVALSSC